MSTLRSRCLRIFASTFLVATATSACASDPSEDTGTASSELSYDVSYGNRIADTARRVDGRGSRNMCLAEVQNSLEAAGVRAFPRLPGAVDLDDFMLRQGGGLTAWGFEKQARGVDDIPRGSIIAWRPGQCGYHSTYGHIEIAIGGGRACSDFCGTIRRGCGSPNVYVPVGRGGGGGGAECGVRQDGRLYCSNRANTPLRAAPSAGAAVVDTLRTTNSWFLCWTTGERHAGDNTTWYATVGDDSGRQGFAPAVSTSTTSEFDANPSAKGLRRCP
ncbi:MAG: hypothetical protein JST00_45345 [Deltaproteobacteria bacterium]|nr:hypothetical protein [Deltaproteobacteria bacterium]